MHDHCVLIYNSYFNCEKIKCFPSCHCSGSIWYSVSEKGQVCSLLDWLIGENLQRQVKGINHPKKINTALRNVERTPDPFVRPVPNGRGLGVQHRTAAQMLSGTLVARPPQDVHTGRLDSGHPPTPTMTGSGLWACTGRQVASQSKPDTKDRERVVARQGLCFIVGQSEDARAAQPARPQHAARPRAGTQMLTRLPPPHKWEPRV